jgi:hypothetical protein
VLARDFHTPGGLHPCGRAGPGREQGVREMIDQVKLEKDGRGWSVAVRLRTGTPRRYRFGSEAQARYFAAVLALGPRTLPPPRRGRRRRAVVAATASP